MTIKQKLEDIDFLINILTAEPFKNNGWISEDKLKEILPYLNELKGFLNFVDKYGEAKLDIMNVANISLGEVPPDKYEFCKIAWYIFNTGLKIGKEGVDINEQSGKN